MTGDLAGGASVEVEATFRCLEEWQEWRAEHPWATDRDHIARVVDSARRVGIVSPFLGSVPAGEVEVGDANFRESLRARGLNPRLRAVLDHFAQLPEAAGRFTTRLYAPEALTPFALELRGRYARFWGSEYAPDPDRRQRLFPIPHEDLAELSLPDGSFDVAFSNEVFEHVPDLPRALAELARILRRGGTLLATFPFAYNGYETIVKARLRGGELQVIGEAEYHPNPVDPAGSLVYQIPGWDILDLARQQGFASAELRFVSSRARGICATELAGIFLLKAVR